MIPLWDDNSGRTSIPVVTYLLIAINVLVFVFLQEMGADTEFTYAFSTVPQEIVEGRDVVTTSRVYVDPLSNTRFRVPGLQPTPIPVYLTLVTAMFMHGGLAHLLGNMLYLMIFGDNVEDRMGKGAFLLFYLLTGVGAGLAHVFSSLWLGADLLVPCLGASGAVSGVLAGYALFFPRNRVRVFLFRFLTRVPAAVVIGFWFLFQLVSAFGVLGEGTRAGGVAYGAHIGGFVLGIVATPLIPRRPR